MFIGQKKHVFLLTGIDYICTRGLTGWLIVTQQLSSYRLLSMHQQFEDQNQKKNRQKNK